MYTVQNQQVNLGRTLNLGAACIPQWLDHRCMSCCEPQPATSPTPTMPVSQDSRLVCTKLFNLWLDEHPAYNECMKREERDSIIGQCIAWHQKRKTLAEAEAEKAKILEYGSCKQTFRLLCEEGYQSWANSNPKKAACQTSNGKEALLQLCIKAKQENWSATKFLTQWNDTAARYSACPVPVPQPPPPPALPAQAAPPPPMPPVAEEALEQITGSPPVASPPSLYVPPLALPPTQAEPSAFRKWGPVLGLALLIGGGAYYIGTR